jgi:hypothetical protein
VQGWKNVLQKDENILIEFIIFQAIV